MHRAWDGQTTLANFDQAFGEHARYYRLHPEIYEFEGASFREIARALRERYVETPAALAVRESRVPYTAAKSPSSPHVRTPRVRRTGAKRQAKRGGERTRRVKES
jgi:hypothetical protein